ncbi:Spt20p [Saccharomyces eubayanus]|uniref:Spt20p n=1 Tax=Saccharomyces eubayanus TaxID=1080349 RepID=UPI0006C41D16|nr:SPT20-like protein [Saccharomyces eubayanus]KOG98932.1 SPT20-like protein [Saccharomyces eubayanus]
MSAASPPGNDPHAFGIPVNATPSSMGSPGSPVNVPQPVNPAAAAVNHPVMKANINNNVNEGVRTLTREQIQQLQQKQRLLLQQKLLQQQKQQQALQNYEAQFYQMLMTLNKRPKRLYNFVEDADSILKKYEQYRPSFEFHIYENNYKICAPANNRLQQQQKQPELTSDGLILTKNNETLKEFLEYVARGRIPDAIMEVLRDCNIQFYEGNLILQVYDHTNTVDVTPKENQPNTNPSSSSPSNVGNTQDNCKIQQPSEPNSGATSTNTSASANAAKKNSSFKRPRVYRTLLKPNDLTTYYDMMSYADHARFSDSIYQQFESEILTLTKRNLSLNVPLNPYEHRDMLEEKAFTEPHWDDSKNNFVHNHRAESTREGTKGVVGHIEEHEEFPQHSSNYEQLMLIMNERTTTITNSTFAVSLTKNAMEIATSNSNGMRGISSSISNSASNTRNNSLANGNQVALAAAAAAAAVGSSMGNDNNQFSRLKFIEQWRINKEKRKQQALSANINPTPFNARISMTAPLTPQQQLLQRQQQALEQQQNGGAIKSSNKRSNTNASSNNSNNGNNSDKPKAKRPRKNAKKSDSGTPAPKKKRVTKKKQSASSTPSSTTIS